MKHIPFLAALSAASLAFVASMSPPTSASSHREAPGITEDPSVDCTDVYSFVSPDNPSTVTLLANYIPLEEPSGGPNYFQFSDSAVYELHVDNSGDAREDITFQWRFRTTTKNSNTFLYNTGPITYDALNDTYPGLNVEQRYDLILIRNGGRNRTLSDLTSKAQIGTSEQGYLIKNAPVAPNNVGPKSIPGGYAPLAAGATRVHPSGLQAFAGPRDDPFFINLGRAFDLLNIDLVLPGGMDAQCGLVGDHLAGFNTHTIAVQVPIQMLTRFGQMPASPADPNAIIGVWSTASRTQVDLRSGGRRLSSGSFTQVSRLGMPLVNELVIPRSHKDIWNASHPKDDSQFLTFVQNSELAGILTALFALPTPPNPRGDLVTVFLTGVPGLNQKGAACEYQRLNMLIAPTPGPNRMGVLAGELDGYPNGRRLTDDTVDISLRVVAGALVFGSPELGDTVCTNDVPFLPSFPYVAPPHDGVTRMHQ